MRLTVAVAVLMLLGLPAALAQPDTVSPSAPNNLQASSVGTGGAVVVWSAATDNVAVTGYDVYANGGLAGTTTSLTFNIRGLGAGVHHLISVEARDAAGNRSVRTTLNIETLRPAPRSMVAAGSNGSMAVRHDGSVWRWGSSASSPSMVPGLTAGFVQVAASGSQAAALKHDGTVWRWASGGTPTLVTMPYSTSPTPGYPPVTGVAAISVGGHESITMLKSDGTIWVVGHYTANNYAYYPTQIGSDGFVAVAVGDIYGLALKQDGTVWWWGSDPGGGGDGTSLQQLSGLTDVVAVAVSGLDRYALKTNGTVWRWSYNQSNYASQVGGLTNVVSIAASNEHCLAAKNDGTVWAWGANTSGQLGDGTTTDRNSPVQVSRLLKNARF